MILELLLGVIVSVALLVVFNTVNFRHSADGWILSIGKFVYYGGHPLLDDDERFEQITRVYKSVVVSFLLVVFKITAIILFGLGTIALMATLGELFRTGTLPVPSSSEFVRLLFPEYLLHWPFITGTLLPLTLLPFLRKKTSEEEYSALDKFLHYLFVGNGAMAKLQFRFECLVHRGLVRSASPSQHVYISGLARAGSTSLMQYLGQLPQFVSLSYQNMPFVFMPRTGPKLISQKKAVEKERSHKDGMTHSLSTYEALEEPFWLHFAGLEFIGPDRLTCHEVTESVHTKYRKFRTLVAGGETYLAKNNNHLLRAKSLHRLDAENGLRSRTVIPFRDPYGQAKSLLEQHRILSALQRENNFALDYMDFLAHHEFGQHVKTFSFEAPAGESLPDTDPDSLVHWLDVWLFFYQAAFDLYATEPDFCFFCYEDYLRKPRESLLSLCSFLSLAPEQLNALEVKEWRRKRSDPIENRAPKVMALYDRMVHEAINHEA